ncbi:MAG: hypothetical protein ACJ75S_11170 [Solirubrobacterales bacterium]
MRRRKLKTEIAIATLECARADLDYEIDRTRSLDSKLTGIASLSGLALSIGAGVGASIVAGGELSLGFTIALGAVLSFASLFLLAAAGVALWGLTPKPFQSLSLKAAEDRVSDERLSGEPADAIGQLAATYYKKMLPEARDTNAKKVDHARWAYRLVGAGLGGLVLGLILTTVAAVV